MITDRPLTTVSRIRSTLARADRREWSLLAGLAVYFASMMLAMAFVGVPA